MADSMPVEQVEDGLSPRHTLFAISSVSHEIRFTIHASRSLRTPLANFFNSFLGLP